MDEQDPEPSRRGALIALAVAVLLAGGGYLLVRSLSGASAIQDCVMAGRSNCAPIAADQKSP